MAPLYRRKAYVAVAALVTQRFGTEHPAVTSLEITEKYDIPARLVNEICIHLVQAGIFAQVVIDAKKNTLGYQLSQLPEKMTAGYLLGRLDTMGLHGFIPSFKDHFPGVESAFAEIDAKTSPVTDNIYLSKLNIKDTLSTK